MTKSDLQQPRAELPDVRKKKYCIFSFGHHKFSLVPVFPVLLHDDATDLRALTLRGIQMIFSPAEARSKSQISGEL